MASSFLILRKEPLEVIHSAAFDLQPASAGGFIGFSREIDKFILPINLIEDKDGSYVTGWTKFFTLTQMTRMMQNRMIDAGTIAGAGLMFGLVGAGIAAAATPSTADNSWLKYKDINRVLWLRYSPETNSFKEKLVSSSLRTKKYFAHSYMSFISHDTAVWMMNRPVGEQGKCSTIFASEFKSLSNAADASLYKIFSDLKINLIYPQSLYSLKGKNYFLAEYDFDNCIHKAAHEEERKIYLIEME